MKVLHKSITNRVLFDGLQNPGHIKHFVDTEINVLGILIREETTSLGEIRMAGYVYTKDGALYGSALSYVKTLRDLATIFGEDISKYGLKVKFGRKDIENSEHQAWCANLA